MTQIPALPLNGGQLSPSSLPGAQKTLVSRPLTPAPEIRTISDGNLTQKTNQLIQWREFGELQANINQARKAESSAEEYAHLLSMITRDVVRNSIGSSTHAAVADLTSTVNKDNLVDGNLIAKTQNYKTHYQLSVSGLIERKDTQEMISVALPNGQQTSFYLYANDNEGSNLSQWQRAFAHTAIRFSEKDGELLISGPEQLMGSPWVIQGEGIRLGAASSVPITPAPTLLATLKGQIESLDLQGSRDSIRSLAKNLDQFSNSVQETLSDLNNIDRSLGISQIDNREALSVLADKVINTLTSPRFSDRIISLKAQANLSPELVSSSIRY